jgi:predicted AAA+ superfamily ATPase
MMTKNIDLALIAQNRHWQGESQPIGVERQYNQQMIQNLTLDEIQIITGIRRCGKSTLLHFLINHLIQNNKISPQNILSVNFDDPNYTDFYTNPAQLYELIIYAEKMTGQKINYLFFDEVQNVLHWEQFIKSVYDSRQFKKIFITGSNADLLKSDYASLLSGRYVETRVFPFQFKEILLHLGIKNEFDALVNKSKLLKLQDELLQYGSFPRIAFIDLKEDKRQLLKSYYETILLNDCIKNHKIRDDRVLSQLAYFLLTNIASLYSYNSLGRAVGTNENTIQSYLQVFENAYLLEELRQYAYSVSDQIRNKKKIYCIDNGLINTVSFQFSGNYGKLFENLVYSELRKQTGNLIYFYQDKYECDFIVSNQGQLRAIQACYQLTPSNQQREVQGLKAAMSKLNIPQGVIITYDDGSNIAPDSIQIIPFWKYFMNN